MKTELTIRRRLDLKFDGSDLGAPRTQENFLEVLAPEKMTEIAERISFRALEFLPPKYYPKNLWLDLEYDAVMTFGDGIKESFPVSLIMSQQLPAESRIRIGMFEIGDDATAFESILAHELGHMLPEWASRATGKVTTEDVVIPFWSKPIYEGVADWFAAVVTGRTLVGSNKIWFHRDILEYPSLSASRSKVGGMVELIERGLASTELVPRFRAYNEWLALVRQHLGNVVDPYAEGQWIASQLWLISNGQRNAAKLFDRVLDLCLSGDQISEPSELIDRLKSV